jgi:hypothetical protein
MTFPTPTTVMNGEPRSRDESNLREGQCQHGRRAEDRCAVGVLLSVVLEGSDVVHHDGVSLLGEVLAIAGGQNNPLDAHGGRGSGELFGLGVVEWLRSDCAGVSKDWSESRGCPEHGGGGLEGDRVYMM